MKKFPATKLNTVARESIALITSHGLKVESWTVVPGGCLSRHTILNRVGTPLLTDGYTRDLAYFARGFDAGVQAGKNII